MSANSKNKILMLLAGILLLTNIALLIFVFNKENGKKTFRGGRENIMTNFLKKEIGFSEDQMQQYDSLSKHHREKIKALIDEAEKNKQSELQQLAAASFSDSAINIIAAQLTEKQKAVEVQMFQHLRDVRQICNNIQLPKFDSLFYKVLSRHGDGRKKSADKK